MSGQERPMALRPITLMIAALGFPIRDHTLLTFIITVWPIR